MNHDIVIRGGTMVDGTGSEPIAGDVAIKDGVVRAVGSCSAERHHQTTHDRHH